MTAIPVAGLAPALTPIELATGAIYGLDPQATDWPDPQPVLRALEDVLAGALARPPCVVSFSGGRDSSAMLAAAVHTAREHSLPMPVAATLVFPGDAEADEEAWQRPVIDHLGVTDWERIVIEGDELDAVGPVAREAMTRHGLLFPFNAHFHVPVMRLARGGTVVTGFGGDELGNAAATRHAARLIEARPRVRGDFLIVGMALAPSAVRRVVIRRRYQRGSQLTWLSESGRAQAASRYAADEAAEPWQWDRLLRSQFRCSRFFRISFESFDRLGADHDAVVSHPLLSSPVLAALAAGFGRVGPRNRDDLMSSVFGDLLPERTVRRPSKAVFTSPLWTLTAREFANNWTGPSPVGGLIDVAALRQSWRAERIDVRSTSLLQAAWLATAGSTGG